MRELLLHVDKVSYEVTKPTKIAEKITEKAKKGEMEDCLFVRIAVEREDEKNTNSVVKNAVEDIIDVCSKLKIKNILLYPYVHLLFGSEPGSVSTSIKILEKMKKDLKNKGYVVLRAPFGFYKKFTVSCKGHPLSELSRSISAGEKKKEGKDDTPDALKNEEKLKSEFYIFNPNGKKHRISVENKKIVGYDFSKHANLEKFVKYELMKDRTVDKEPPHIKVMKRLEFVDYEKGSDPGHFRYMPKGRFVKSLLEEWVTKKTLEYGAMEVETPLVYDYEHPSLKKYLNRFPARQYTIETPNKRVFLRFSACFGQFLMAHDATISYRNLPLRMYEMTRYSFRVEQRGELAGLRRLRAFTMPDCHALCADFDQAKKEMMRRFQLTREIKEGIGLRIKDDMEFAVRVVKDFYEEHREFVHSLIKEWGKPVLVEIWDKRFFYFVFKHEWNFVDGLGKAATLATDQFDVENAERYGIMYTDKDNKKKYPIILHLSPSGAIERVIYALLERECMRQAGGRNPMLPLWLSPTHIRLCPMNDSMVKHCEQLAEKFSGEQIRVDIDDRVESISKKVRDAEMEWVPYSIVIGDREKKSGSLPVRFRSDGKVRNMSFAEIVNEIKSKTDGLPYKPLPLDRLLSKRPIFFG